MHEINKKLYISNEFCNRQLFPYSNNDLNHKTEVILVSISSHTEAKTTISPLEIFELNRHRERHSFQ